MHTQEPPKIIQSLNNEGRFEVITPDGPYLDKNGRDTERPILMTKEEAAQAVRKREKASEALSVLLKKLASKNSIS